MRVLVVTVAVWCGLIIAGTAAAQQPVDPAEASLRILRRAVTLQRDGSHQSLLFALRQLRDPDLAPLLTKLVQSKHWPIQVHGVLALGEIDSHKQIDPSHITALPPAAQDAAIATALDLQLLPVDRFADLLQSEDLQPMARLVLMAELVALSKPVDAQLLRSMADSDELIVAGMASALLAQLGETKPWLAFVSRLQALTGKRKADLEVWTLEAIKRYKLTACLPWITSMLDQPSVDADLAYRCVVVMLELDPPAGLKAWAKHLGAAPGYQQRVRYTSALLTAGEKVPLATYDRITVAADEEVLMKLLAVGRALSSRSDIIAPLIALLDLSNARTTAWAVEYINKLPDEQATKVYVHLLNRLNDDRASNEAVSLAVQAVPKLFQIEPELVLSRLRDAADDSGVQQALLLGLFDVDSPKVGEAVKSLRRIGSGRADSLALLLLARHEPRLERRDLDQLGKIAAGGVQLSEVLQVQAAWLYVKHTGQVNKAVAALFE